MLSFDFDPGPFLLVTVILGGSAAFVAGRAVAQTWRPWWQGIAYMLILGAAVHFVHYAMFGGAFELNSRLRAGHRRGDCLFCGGISRHASAADGRQYGFLRR